MAGRMPLHPGHFCPTGKSASFYRKQLSLMSSLRRKNVPLPFFVKTWFSPRIPLHPRGALRDRHERWRRDAVDASCAKDERARCGRRSRVVPIPRRWDQALRDEREATVAKKPGAPRRPRISRNPLRRECRLSRLPCCCLRAQKCTLLARKATGAASIRHSLRPPCSGRANVSAKARA